MKTDYSLNDSLGYLTRLYNQLILRRITEELALNGIDITSDQWILLVFIWGEGGLTQNELATRIFKDKSRTTRLLKSLEIRGLVKRQECHIDNREKRTHLTEKGKTLMDSTTAVVQNILDKSYAGIDPEKLNNCREVLRLGARNLT